MRDTAHFVNLPFTLQDLRRPHFADDRRSFAIEKTVELELIEYENFITDLCVDRWYIEENADLMFIDADGVFHCLLVQCQGYDSGVLIMSDGCDFPKWAAYLPKEQP